MDFEKVPKEEGMRVPKTAVTTAPMRVVMMVAMMVGTRNFGSEVLLKGRAAGSAAMRAFEKVPGKEGS